MLVADVRVDGEWWSRHRLLCAALDEPLNFLDANFSDRQALEERVELVHAQEDLFGPALFSLSVLDVRRLLGTVIADQDALEVFFTTVADLVCKKPLPSLDHSPAFTLLPLL